MRSGFFFFDRVKRNDPVRLSDPHPLTPSSDITTGDAGRDGYSVLSRADPDRAGSPPPVKGNEGPAHQGPDQSFEQ